MPKSDNNWSEVIEKREYRNEGLSRKGKRKVLIRKCDFSYNKRETSMLRLSNCRYCRIEDCEFHGKDTLGVTLKIDGEKTRFIEIDGCKFYDLIQKLTVGSLYV
jgi:hypothetical protein